MTRPCEPALSTDMDEKSAIVSGRLSARRVTEELVASAAWRGERIIGVCRIVFCVAVLVRFAAVAPGVPAQGVAFNVAVILSAIAFSLWMLSRIRRGRATSRALSLSVVLDVAVCFCSLLQTSLWPNLSYGTYTGLLARPDPAALLLVVISAGFRLSPRLSLLGSVLSGAAFAALVLLERARHASSLTYGVFDVTLFAVLLAGMAALSYVVAQQTRSLVESGALASFKVDRTRRNLARIVREHHDAKSVLSAALLDAERVSSFLASGGGHVTRDSAELASRVARELGEVSAAVRLLSEDAMEQMAGLDDVVCVDVDAVLPPIVDALRQRFPSLAIDLDLAEHGSVRVAGGRPSLERMLYNLASNALEGDGARGAASLSVSTSRRGGHLVLRLDDDGPGFCHALLECPTTSALGTKANGSGLGLYGVAQILEMSGGAVHRSNRGPSGARVELEFLVA
jgi:signal transduction histidine kinase